MRGEAVTEIGREGERRRQRRRGRDIDGEREAYSQCGIEMRREGGIQGQTQGGGEREGVDRGRGRERRSDGGQTRGGYDERDWACQLDRSPGLTRRTIRVGYSCTRARRKLAPRL